MFNYKIKFVKRPPAEDTDDDEVFEMIEDLINVMINNGQLIGGFDVFAGGDAFYANVVLPEEDSLSGKYDNVYIKERYGKLHEYFDTELIREGRNIKYDEPCVCEKPSWYYLSAAPDEEESPLFCGDCFRSVPLYKIPYIDDRCPEHATLVHWQNAYKNMYYLWIHSLWDKFTGSQIYKHDSKLNAEGRDICRELEKVLRVPVYYNTYYGVGSWVGPREPPAVCPDCGGEWNRTPEFFMCEKCRLMTENPEWDENDDDDDKVGENDDRE